MRLQVTPPSFLPNPFETSISRIDYKVLRIFLNEKTNRKQTMGDFWSDVGGFIGDGISGLGDALGNAVTAIVDTIKQLGETIALVVRACLGDVSWNEVLDSLGKVFQDIGTAMVFLDPTRGVYNWLSTAPLTAHAFHELDKFTGGDLTTIANLSDLPGRVLRGDAISKYELLADALLVIKVVVMIVTFPEGLALMAAMMVGRQVCSHQSADGRAACMAAFTIVGIALGNWAGSGDTFFEALQDSGLTFLEDTGVNLATREAVLLCQQNQWAGKNECAILGQALADYIKSGSDDDWSTFLADEIVKIGAQQLMIAWFPPGSREHNAIVNHGGTTPRPLPGQPGYNVVSIPGANGLVTTTQKPNTAMTYILLAAGALTLAAGVS